MILVNSNSLIGSLSKNFLSARSLNAMYSGAMRFHSAPPRFCPPVVHRFVLVSRRAPVLPSCSAVFRSVSSVLIWAIWAQ
jgi:hypothetical protein